MSLSDKRTPVIANYGDVSKVVFYNYDEKDVKEFIEIINTTPNKSLESTGMDLCGYSHDDVWEEAIKWFKEEINKEAGNKLCAFSTEGETQGEKDEKN